MLEIFTKSSKKSLIVLGILTFLYFLENFDRYLIAVSPIPYIDYSSYEYSILAGPAFAIVYTVGGLFFALGYTDYNREQGRRIGKYGILSISTFIFSAAFGLTALAENFWQQVIIRIVMGLAQSVITPFSTSLIRDYFPVEIMGSALGIFNTGVYFAFALSLSLGIFVYTRYGWQAGYVLFGLIGIGGSFLLPMLSCCKLSTEGVEDNYKVISVDDLDASFRGSEGEKASFFLYSNTGSISNIPKPSFASVNSPLPGQNSMSQSNLIGHSSSAPLSPTKQMMNADSNNPNSPIRSPIHNSEVFFNSAHEDNNPMRESETIGEGREEEIIIGGGPRKSSVRSSYEDRSNIVRASGISRKNQSLGYRMWKTTHEIVFIYWWKNPGIYLLCLATGVRLGGGYIWSAYTGVFFSDLFVTQENSIHCSYSYNPNDSTGMHSHNTVLASSSNNNVCDSDYPYCVSGDCKALMEFPWHNEVSCILLFLSFFKIFFIVLKLTGNDSRAYRSIYVLGAHCRVCDGKFPRRIDFG
jgi:hypothetical protein